MMNLVRFQQFTARWVEIQLEMRQQHCLIVVETCSVWRIQQTRTQTCEQTMKPAQRSRNTTKEGSFDGRSVTRGQGDEGQRPEPGSKFSRADPPTAQLTEVTKPGVGAALLLALTIGQSLIPFRCCQGDTHTHMCSHSLRWYFANSHWNVQILGLCLGHDDDGRRFSSSLI